MKTTTLLFVDTASNHNISCALYVFVLVPLHRGEGAFMLCKDENPMAGAREPGGGGARGAIAPQLLVSMGWICLCPP